MLERMRRETSQQYIADLIKRIRAGVPGIALRTTFIVGFPGETEEYFKTLVDFIETARFERLGVFTFSQELLDRRILPCALCNGIGLKNDRGLSKEKVAICKPRV